MLYREQLIFTNRKVKEMIESILTNSPQAPIVVLQGDHGPISDREVDRSTELEDGVVEYALVRERFAILNAIYYPDGNYERLYADMTPVNTFRLLLNQHFGATHDRLDDVVYFAPKSPYRYMNVTVE